MNRADTSAEPIFVDVTVSLSAIRQLRTDYEGHCRAARRLVEEHFDARRVLTVLLERSL